MTVHDYTAYLGKNVFFALKSHINPRIDNLFYVVEGRIDAILLSENFQDSGFRLDDEIYKFSDVVFFEQSVKIDFARKFGFSQV